MVAQAKAPEPQVDLSKGAAIVEINENSYWTPVLPVNDC